MERLLAVRIRRISLFDIQRHREEVEKVKTDLYMIAGEGGNVAVYVTSEGVVLVDDMFDRNHADILAQVKAITPAPIGAAVSHQV